MRRYTPVGLTGRWILAVSFAAVASGYGVAQVAAQGASDIYVAHIHQAAGRVVVDSVERVRTRAGYNNQPAFLRDGRRLMYTSADSVGQADIWIYDMSHRPGHPLTKTAPESEYSATQMPGSSRFSVIRVEKDSAQRLWSFRDDGTDPRVLLAKLKPIGYQAWVDAKHVAVFVLGDAATRTPATLQLVDIRDESAVPIATGIGRALQPVPGRAAVSFTQRDSAKTRWIDVYDVASKKITHAARSLPENEYHVWLPNGTLVSARGSTLMQIMPGRDADWSLIADLADRGVKGITRLAVSADGKMIAFVAAH